MDAPVPVPADPYRYPKKDGRSARHNNYGRVKMQFVLTIVIALLISTCCLAQDGNGPQPNQAIDLTELLTKLEKLEQRVKDLESDRSVNRRTEGQKTQATQPNGAVAEESATSPALRPTQMRSIYWFPPMVGWSTDRGQQPMPSPPPRGEVPANWQQINYFGRWYYLVPIEEGNSAPADQRIINP